VDTVALTIATKSGAHRRREHEERKPEGDALRTELEAALAAVPPRIRKHVTTAYMLPKGRLLVYTATRTVCGKSAYRTFVFVGSRLDRATTEEMRSAFRRLDPTGPSGETAQPSQTTTRPRTSHGRRPGHRRARKAEVPPATIDAT
jgi:hypothetical protein